MSENCIENYVEKTLKPIFLKRPQVAEMLNLCERSIFALDKSGALKSVRIGAAVRYRYQDVLAFAESGEHIALKSK